ncbi:DNA topoisomerase VI subunit B [Candidatus Woesearchaeota archaeon]|nr:DNA topoisomerase VI subunit B [Candidatus Woesearchaeota archaeon]
MSKEEVKGNKPIAHELAKKQREISVAEFFEKNRHLLGFDNKRKALLTTVKEAVDNALDACEEAKVLPEVNIQIIDMSSKPDVKKEVDKGQTTLVTEEVKEVPILKQDRFRIIVEDNGPGIVKKQIPNIFAKMLYGSKFHTLKQSRGQQGIGISAAALYGQLTTGKPVKIISKISPKHPAHYYELIIDTRKNEPKIVNEKEVEWNKDHGTKVEIDLEGSYQSGGQSVDKYLKQTAIVNPHVTIIYTNPEAKQMIFPRAVEELPKEQKEIKPHPYGVELGRLIKMLSTTKARSVHGFLMSDFSRVGSGTSHEICKNASILPDTKPKQVTREMAEKLEHGIKKTKIMNPPTDCISPIGAEALEKGLRKEIKAEFYAAVTRPPAVYRGNPFIIEAGIAYGGEQEVEGQIKLLRYANRVPLLYQQGACAVTKSVLATNWRSYGLSQSRGALPIGPCTLVLHIASVWVPFTSESKEAIAHYPEIIKEIKLALQECGRKLAMYVKKKIRIVAEGKKRGYIETYIPHVADALKQLLKLTEVDEEKIKKLLKQLLEKQRGKLDQIKVDASDFDESLALEEGEKSGKA